VNRCSLFCVEWKETLRSTFDILHSEFRMLHTRSSLLLRFIQRRPQLKRRTCNNYSSPVQCTARQCSASYYPPVDLCVMGPCSRRAHTNRGCILTKTKNTLLQAQRALEAKNTPQRISRRMVLPIFVVFLLDANAIDRRLTAT